MINVNSFKKHGFQIENLELIENPEDGNLLDKLYDTSKEIKLEQKFLKSGYSENIFEKLPLSLKKEIIQLGEKILKNKIIQSNLFFPSLLNQIVLKTGYSEMASNNPTHAQLWHRDFDDYYPQIKVIIALHPMNKDNGMFSVASKQVCNESEILLDNKLCQKLSQIDDKYRKQDVVRVSNETFVKHFDNYIYNFECAKGDMLFVDTNNCYHKGGQILQENKERIVLHLMYGSITNRYSKFFIKGYEKNSNYFRNTIYKIVIKFAHKFKQLLIILKNKSNFRSKKKILN